jgi:hypothetical protein
MKSGATVVVLLSALSVFAATTSRAQAPVARPWVQAIDIRSQDAVAQANAVSAVIKRELSRPTGVGFQLDPLLREQGCPTPPDSACLARLAGRLEADQFVWGHARRTSPGKVRFELHMYSRGEPERYTEITLDDTLIDPSNPVLVRQVQSAVSVLITRGGPATVRLRAGNLGGQVWVDGRPITELAEGRADLSLRPGEHRIEVRSPGYLPQARSIFVQPTTQTELLFEPVVDPAAEPRPSAPTNWHKNIGWGAIGSGLVLTGLGAWSTTKVKNVSDSEEMNTWRRQTFGDVCTEAKSANATAHGGVSPSTIRDMCDTSSLHSTLQFVFYGTALLSFGTGIYLLATDPGPSKSQSSRRFQILPTVGKQGGELNARFTF